LAIAPERKKEGDQARKGMAKKKKENRQGKEWQFLYDYLFLLLDY